MMPVGITPEGLPWPWRLADTFSRHPGMWWNVGRTLMLQLKRRHLRATGAEPTGARHGAARPAIAYLWLPNTVKSVA